MYYQIKTMTRSNNKNSLVMFKHPFVFVLLFITYNNFFSQGYTPITHVNCNSIKNTSDCQSALTIIPLNKIEFKLICLNFLFF